MLKSVARPTSPIVLAQSGAAVSHTGNTNETTLATVVIPANSMGPNGAVRLTTLWTATNNANGKSVITRFGGQIVASNAPASFATYREQRQIINRNATNSQATYFGSFSGFGTSGAALNTQTIDTTQNVNLVIATQLTNAADTITLEAYTVEIIPSP